MAKPQNLEIIMMSIEEITPYENNPRQNDETVRALKRAIKKYGFNQPIVVDKKGVIVKGHARWTAAKEMGLGEIPVIVSAKSAKVNRADRIADNAIQDLSRWDAESLALEMRDVEGAIASVLGETEQDYAVMKIDLEVRDKDLAAAREKLEPKEPQRLIRVVCKKCGAEMFLSRTAVEGLI